MPNVPLVPHFDEAALARPPNQGWTSPLVSYTVADPRPIVRTESSRTPLVVDGDANGVVAAASVGLLAGNPTILYAGTLDTDPHLEQATLGAPGRPGGHRHQPQAGPWSGTPSRRTPGTPRPPRRARTQSDPTDEPLNLFPRAPADAQTTAAYDGIASVNASSYGSSITYLPEDRPYNAIDGNTQTAWVDNSFAAPQGQWWQVVLDHPTTERSLTLIQPQTGDPDRSITRVTLTFDGRDPVSVPLGRGLPHPARAGGHLPGPDLHHPAHHHHRGGGVRPVRARHLAQLGGLRRGGDPRGDRHRGHLHARRTCCGRPGPSSSLDRLSLVMTRLRSSGTPPFYDTETTLDRSFWLPTARTFSLTGSASISPLIPDDMIDRLVGRPGADGTGIVAYSLGRLPGDLRAGAIATLDDNSSTIWEPGFGATHQAGEWLEYHLPAPVTFDHLDLQIVADGQHSVPTSLTVVAGGQSATVALPPLADSRVPGSVVDVPVSFPALTGPTSRSPSIPSGSRTPSTTTPRSPSPCPSGWPKWASPASRPRRSQPTSPPRASATS